MVESTNARPESRAAALWKHIKHEAQHYWLGTKVRLPPPESTQSDPEFEAESWRFSGAGGGSLTAKTPRAKADRTERESERASNR